MPEQPGQTRSAKPAVRPLGWSLVACTALCLLVPRPSYADPGNTTVPDAGAVPVASAPLQVPGAGTATTAADTASMTPTAAHIQTETAAVEALGEKLQQAQADATAANQSALTLQQTWEQAESAARTLRTKADAAAAQAYQKAEALGPLGTYASTMQQLGVLAPGLTGDTAGGVAGSQSAAEDAKRAEQQAQTAYMAYQAALTTQWQKDQDQSKLQAQYSQRSSALEAFKAANPQAVAQADAVQQAQDRALALGYEAGTNAAGWKPGAVTKKAMDFAFRQLGAPYIFGHQGPTKADGYDCSGLTWRSYLVAGVNIPRIANDQYHGITHVAAKDLVPGDLLFFSPTSTTDWTQISHVGMYIGDNLMIEAPHTGEVVKIAPIWWSAFFGAGRVAPAIPPAKTPAPAPTSTSTPSPKPTPSHTPAPTPSTTPTLPSTRPSPSTSTSGSSGSGSSPTPGNTPASASVAAAGSAQAKPGTSSSGPVASAGS